MGQPIVHFDISGPDGQALQAFYAGLLGWEVEARGPGYAQVTTAGGAEHGAIVENEQPSVVLGVGVPDLSAAVQRAEALGGEVLMAPMDNGWVSKATVADPAGNPLTLILAPGT